MEFATILEIKPFEKGKRVLLDFAQDFLPTDYIFVGNTFYGFFAIPSENRQSVDYLPRDFRFNAGAINSYILTDTGVKYLTEIKCGQKVLVYKNNSLTPLSVARVKCEIRDLTLVKAKLKDKEFSIIVQSGNTTAFVGKDNLIYLNELKVGDKVLIKPHEKSSHLGQEKIEFCEEYWW